MHLSPLMQRRFVHALVATMAGVIVAAGLQLCGILDIFEARTYDWRVRLMARPGAASSEIGLIFLDQQSLDWGSRENGLSWPWPREVYAVVLDFCRRAGVKALAFDMLYTEPSKYGVADDAAMAQALV